MILHGDDDQIVPIGASAMLPAKLIKNATLKVYQGASHGLCSTHEEQIDAGCARLHHRVRSWPWRALARTCLRRELSDD